MGFGRASLSARPSEGGTGLKTTGASSGDMGKSAQLLLAPYAPASGAREIPPRALDRHEASVKLMIDVIASRATSREGSVWWNTCDWMVARKIGLHVLTPLRPGHAEQVWKAQRAEKTGSDRVLDGAHFGIDSEVPLGPASSGSGGLIAIVPLAQRSFAETGKIVIVDPIAISDREQIKAIISYEVQLAAAHEQPSTKEEDKYRSEFSMRWAAGYHSDKSDQLRSAAPVTLNDGKVVRGMHNARQAAIFADLYNTSDFVAPAWNDWWSGRSFQNAVYKLKAPQGKNLVNSERIDNLYMSLTADPIRMAGVNDAIKALSPEDQEALRDPAGGMVNVWHDILRDAALSPEDRVRLANDLGIYGFSP